MRRFSGLVLILITVSVSVLLLSRFIGTLYPLPPLTAKLFTQLDGQPCQIPCLFGIHPDQPNIFAALKVHPALNGVDSYIRGNDLDKITGYQTDSFRIQASEYEQWIDIAVQPPTPSLSSQQ